MLPAKTPKSNGRHQPPLPVPEPMTVPAVVTPGPAAMHLLHSRRVPQPPSAFPDAAALMASLQRRWFLALFLGLLALGGTAYGLWQMLPQTCTVRTLLHVSSNRPSTAMLTGYSESLMDFASFQKTQIAIIKSRLVLKAALDQPQVKALPIVREKLDPCEWLEKDLKVDYKLAPEIISIALNGEDPAQMAAVVNAVRDAYLRDVVNKERNQKLELLARLQKFYGEKESLLKERRKKFRELAESVGSRDAQTLAHKQQFAIERLALAQKEMMELQSQLRRAQVTEAAEQKLPATADDIVLSEKEIEEEIRRDKTIEELQSEIARQEQVLKSIRRVLRNPDSDPSVAIYQNSIAAAREAIEQRRKELRPEIEARLRSQAEKDQIVGRRKQKKDVVISKELEKRLKEEVEKLQAETFQINRGSLDLDAVKEEITQADDMAKKVGSQIDALRVELQAPSRVSLLEDATVLRAEAEKKRMGMIGAGSLGSFALILFGVALWDYRGRRVSTADEVSNSLGLPVLAVLPRLPRRGGNETQKWNVAADKYVFDEWIESVNAARTMMLHAARDEAVKTVMVVSALEGEGKTSLSCHLASSLAHKFPKVLLIDGDLRRPSVHKKFGMEPGPGLSEVLRGEAKVEDVIRTSPVKNLFILDAGASDYETLKTLAREPMDELFAQLKKDFDFIVVDSSPLLHVSDSLLFAQKVDAVIFSVFREVSRLPAVYAAYEKILMLGVRVLGTIMHGMPRSRRGYSSYSYSYSYALPRR